ncbi:MAG TPA: hypothetical protein VLT81_03855 [Chondromyces sp.]|nr:hypothetical protein [Chondromyces sp.]
MYALVIFALGVLVIGVAIAAVFLIGFREADDPAHSQPEDLTELERSVVDRELDENAAESDSTA